LTIANAAPQNLLATSVANRLLMPFAWAKQQRCEHRRHCRTSPINVQLLSAIARRNVVKAGLRSNFRPLSVSFNERRTLDP
jgi:hypothetical protein